MRSIFVGILLLAAVVTVFASSHSEAPGIVNVPPVDSTDLYAFMSYEEGREDYVTILALYNPLQKPFAGPNYYQFSNQHYYEILVDHRGTGTPSTIIQFTVNSELRDVTGFQLPIGPNGNKKLQSIPLKFFGAITAKDQGNLNWYDTYKVKIIRNNSTKAVINPRTNTEVFVRPFDYAGTKTFPNYASYSNQYIYTVEWPVKCSGATDGKIFVGQRKDPFYIYLGGVFDLVNFIPIDGLDPNLRQNAPLLNHLRDLNIGVFAVEIHKSCLLLNGNNGNLGIWTRTRNIASGVQRARLGNPLVNELFIGIDQKNYWNKLTPDQDEIFNVYIEYPTLPKILDILFINTVRTVPGFQNVTTIEPQVFPRSDLLSVFHTGISGLNQLPLTEQGNIVYADMLRLNTDIAPKKYNRQNALGVIASDLAGWPNGRRPKDDIVDIALRAALGVLLNNNDVAPLGALPITDFVPPTASDYIDEFPYLALPIPGSKPNRV